MEGRRRPSSLPGSRAAYPLLGLPSRCAWPTTNTSLRGMRCIALSAPLCAQLRRLSEQDGTPPYILVLAALSALLQRYTGQHHLTFASCKQAWTRQERGYYALSDPNQAHP